jgi:toxin ParE1/3/4
MGRAAPLVWTAPALDDLDDVAAWIALENESAAGALIERTLAAVERLRRFPNSGRRLPELPKSVYREVVVNPCRVIYRREGNRVLIVHVLRGERQLRRARLR